VNRQGLTLIEVVISTVLFSLVLASLAVLVVTSKQFLLHTRSRTVSSQLGKFFLDPLQNEVNQTVWNNTCLGSLNGAMCTANYTAPASGYTSNVSFLANYTVSNVSSALRRVRLRVQWNETN
jgi:Tfp pilus assembly protein PilV